MGIFPYTKYPSMGIIRFLERSLLCSRFLSYCTRMNFELVLRCGTRVLVPHLFFVKSNGLHKKQTHSNDTDDSAYDFAQGHLLMEKDGCRGNDKYGRERKECLCDARRGELRGQ